MANILLVANLNCDHVLSLAEPLVAGARMQYVDQGRRLGGGEMGSQCQCNAPRRLDQWGHVAPTLC